MEQRESDIKIYVPRHQGGGNDIPKQRPEQPEPKPEPKPGDLPPEIVCRGAG